MSQQINLFNPVFMKQRKYFSAVTMLQALALIVLGVSLFYVYAVYQVRSLSKQLDETSKSYIEGQAKLQHYTAGFSPQESSQMLDNELQSAETRLAAQRELIETMKGGAIGNTTGYSAYMRAFARQAVDGLWLSGFEIIGDGAEMSISGSVLSADLLPAYIRKLAQEPALRGKSFAALQMRRRDDGMDAVEFTLQSGETGGVEEK